MAGVEAALIVSLRIARDRNLQWPLILMAALSAALLAAGVLRHYLDIYLHRTVRGISFLFVGIDAAGDLFSLVSLLFQSDFDILGLTIYGTELILWIGVFACGGYYNFLPWLHSRLERGRVANDCGNIGGISSACSRTSGRQTGATTDPIALHALPSSTSVFRTPSADLDVIRRRPSFGSRGTSSGS